MPQRLRAYVISMCREQRRIKLVAMCFVLRYFRRTFASRAKSDGNGTRGSRRFGRLSIRITLSRQGLCSERADARRTATTATKRDAVAPTATTATTTYSDVCGCISATAPVISSITASGEPTATFGGTDAATTRARARATATFTARYMEATPPATVSRVTTTGYARTTARPQKPAVQTAEADPKAAPT